VPEETRPASTVPDSAALVPQRLVSVCRQGWMRILVAWLNQAPLPSGCFIPAPWPAGPVRGAEEGVEPVMALPQAA
jgi:hypothetical protein